jgi:arabinogalactan oligomer/maltooligosaccharide transport system permease protein
MFLSKSLGTNGGTINEILIMLGAIEKGNEIKFLEDQLIAKITIIVVNMWIGIPYTMLMCSGLLMNIPADLYESARIDGANPFKMYTKITLPYMLFVTGPYLISSFVGNINNFNVIYLLSGGGPTITSVNGVVADANMIYGAGHTDLLITWLYKMCMTSTEKNYALASVIGICIFVVLSSISLVVYGRSSAVKNEEDFA